MRISLSVLTAAGLLTSQMAGAQCARSADTTALDIAGLKTTLMVTALTCSADTKYNDFVIKYRPEAGEPEQGAGRLLQPHIWSSRPNAAG